MTEMPPHRAERRVELYCSVARSSTQQMTFAKEKDLYLASDVADESDSWSFQFRFHVCRGYRPPTGSKILERPGSSPPPKRELVERAMSMVPALSH